MLETPNLTCLVTGPMSPLIADAIRHLMADSEWSVLRVASPKEVGVAQEYPQFALRHDEPQGADDAYSAIVAHLEGQRTPWFDPQLDVVVCALEGFYNSSPLEIQTISRQFAWIRRLVPHFAGSARLLLVPAEGANSHLTDAFTRMVNRQLARDQAHLRRPSTVILCAPDVTGELLAQCVTEGTPPPTARARDVTDESVAALTLAVRRALDS